jgi:hypothetical protein
MLPPPLCFQQNLRNSNNANNFLSDIGNQLSIIADFVLYWIPLLSQYYLADYNEQGQCGTATEVEPQILYTGHLQYKPWKRPKPFH